MNKEYLHQLPLEPSVREKIAQLDAPTPVSLLSMIKAAPEAFNQYVGQDVAQDLEQKLYPMLTDNEKHIVRASPPKEINFQGAMLEHSEMPIRLPQYDISKRDEIFNEIQDLKAVINPAPEVKRQILELQNNLENLLTEESS